MNSDVQIQYNIWKPERNLGLTGHCGFKIKINKKYGIDVTHITRILGLAKIALVELHASNTLN